MNRFYKWCISNGFDKGLQLDRIDNDGNYEPGNCRFVTAMVNANNKSTNRWVKVNDCFYTLSDAVRLFSKLSYSTVHNRYVRLGWTLEDSLNSPPSY